MKKLNLIIFSFLIISLPCISQKEPKDVIVNISRISFPDLGYSYELRVGKFKSLVGKISLNPVPIVLFPLPRDNNSLVPGGFPVGTNFSLGGQISFTLIPTFNLSYRNYYKFNKGKNKNKKIAKNSLNYYSPIITSGFTQNNFEILKIKIFESILDYFPIKNIQFQQSYATIGFVWGMQRNYNNRFSFDLSTGLGLNYLYKKTTYSDGSTTLIDQTNLTPIIQISLGVWLNKVK